MSGKLCRLLTVALVAGALLCATSVPGWAYLAVKGGMFMPNDDDDGLKPFDNGFAGEACFGTQLGPVAIEVGGGYYKTSLKEGDGDLSIIPITGTAKLSFNPTPVLGIYVGGGAGYYLAKFEGGGDSEDDNGIGFHAVGGVEIPLGVVSLLAEAKWYTCETDDNEVQIGGILILGGLKF